MTTNYSPLRLSKPVGNIGFLMGEGTRKGVLNRDDPAIKVFTDFYLTPAISVLATTKIDDAITRMIRSGVRLLFVVTPSFDVLGSITSYDIQGEKPLRYLQSRDCRIGICARGDIQVQDIMVPVSQWKVINYEQLVHAKVGEVALTFNELDQTHLIVIETMQDSSRQVVRGLLSLTTLERALDISINSRKVASTFSEIRRALAV